VHALLAQVAPEFAVDLDERALQRLPSRALPRYMVGGTISVLVLAVLVIAGLQWWRGEVPWWGYAPLALVPFQVVAGWLAYRDAGWALGDRVLVLRSRSLARTTLVTTRRRIQHRSLTANPLQRRAGLATLHVSVAGGGQTSLPHVDRESGEHVLFGINPRYAGESGA
jgi:putative membrane protein